MYTPEYSVHPTTGDIIEDRLEDLYNDFMYDQVDETTFLDLKYFMSRIYPEVKFPDNLDDFYISDGTGPISWLNSLGMKIELMPAPEEYTRQCLSAEQLAHSSDWWYAKLGESKDSKFVLATTMRGAIMLSLIQVLRDLNSKLLHFQMSNDTRQ